MRRCRSENMPISQNEMLTAAAAEGAFDPQEHAVARAEPEADPIVGLEAVEAEIFQARCDAARVVENGAVDRREDLPAILGLQQEDVLVPEAELPEAAQVVGTAQGALVVERHLLSRARFRGRRERAQRQHAAIAEQRHILLQVHVDTAEGIPPEVAIVEALVDDLVLSAAARIA